MGGPRWPCLCSSGARGGGEDFPLFFCLLFFLRELSRQIASRALCARGARRTRCAPCLSFVAKIASHACGKKCGLFCATRAVRARRAASAAAPASFGLGFEFFAGLSRRVFPKTTCVSKRLPSTTFRNIQVHSGTFLFPLRIEPSSGAQLCKRCVSHTCFDAVCTAIQGHTPLFGRVLFLLGLGGLSLVSLGPPGRGRARKSSARY